MEKDLRVASSMLWQNIEHLRRGRKYNLLYFTGVIFEEWKENIGEIVGILSSGRHKT